MKRLTFGLFSIALFFLLGQDVFALDPACTQQEQIRLRNLASATKITYEFYKDDVEDLYGYKVRIAGFSPDFYVYNKNNGTFFEYTNSPIVENAAFADGVTYNLPFYASDTGVCKGYLILTKTIALPKYNVYSDDPLCKGYEAFELCKRFTPMTVDSYDQFVTQLDNYIKGLKNPSDGKPNDEDKTQKTIIDKIIDFVANNYLYILGGVIIVGTSIIIVIVVRKRRSIL